MIIDFHVHGKITNKVVMIHTILYKFLLLKIYLVKTVIL